MAGLFPLSCPLPWTHGLCGDPENYRRCQVSSLLSLAPTNQPIRLQRKVELPLYQTELKFSIPFTPLLCKEGLQAYPLQTLNETAEHFGAKGVARLRTNRSISQRCTIRPETARAFFISTIHSSNNATGLRIQGFNKRMVQFQLSVKL